MTAPKRRWFAYSLRTMFVVVTVFAIPVGWIAHQLNWIRQRREFLENFGPAYPDAGLIVNLDDETEAPGMLWLFGERGLWNINIALDGPAISAEGKPWGYLPIDPEPEPVMKAKRLFPETEIEWR